MTLLIATLVRWAGLAALAAVIGACAVDRLLPRADAGGGARLVHDRLARWSLGWVAVLAATSLGELVLRAATLAGGVARAIPALPVVLTRTHYGAIWVGRAAAVALLAALIAAGGRRARTGALAAAGAVALTTALVGHAGDAGDVTLAVLLDWIHIVAGSVWIGGVAALALVMSAGGQGVGVPCAGRFSRVAGGALAAVVVSGVWNAWTQVREPVLLLDTAYGRVLLAKVVLVGVLVALGAMNRYAVLPALGGPSAATLAARAFRRGLAVVRASAPASVTRLGSLITREAVIGAAVLALTAVLGDSTPARHAGHTAHVADDDAAHASSEPMHDHGAANRAATPSW